jgi:acyl-CoA dehydrogenase
MLGPSGSAYERMALPFRDIEDAVGTFGTLGALRHALGRFAGAVLEQTEDLGAIVAMTAVFAAGAETVVGSLDDGRLHTSNAALVGLRVLAADIVARLRPLAGNAPLEDILADLDATLSIAGGPRLARQTQLGADASRAARNP